MLEANYDGGKIKLKRNEHDAYQWATLEKLHPVPPDFVANVRAAIRGETKKAMLSEMLKSWEKAALKKAQETKEGSLLPKRTKKKKAKLNQEPAPLKSMKPGKFPAMIRA